MRALPIILQHKPTEVYDSLNREFSNKEHQINHKYLADKYNINHVTVQRLRCLQQNGCKKPKTLQEVRTIFITALQKARVAAKSRPRKEKKALLYLKDLRNLSSSKQLLDILNSYPASKPHQFVEPRVRNT